MSDHDDLAGIAVPRSRVRCVCTTSVGPEHESAHRAHDCRHLDLREVRGYERSGQWICDSTFS